MKIIEDILVTMFLLPIPLSYVSFERESTSPPLCLGMGLRFRIGFQVLRLRCFGFFPCVLSCLPTVRLPYLDRRPGKNSKLFTAVLPKCV